MAIAGYALLDTVARRHNGYDAVIVGAFCHAFVPATKELMPVPVVGIAEASMRAAQILGRRIAIIGLGAPDRGGERGHRRRPWNGIADRIDPTPDPFWYATDG